MNYTPEKLKQYLIGSLPETEADKIGLQIISGKISEDNLLIAENDLIEDYLENNLSPEELELFKENFLISRERESQISQISLLKNYAKKFNAEKKTHKNGEDKETGFFSKLMISPLFLPLRAVFALIIVGFFVWLFSVLFITNSSNQQIAALERKFEQINKGDFSDIAEFSTFSKVNLASGSFRGADELNTLAKQNLTEKVLVRLALPTGFNSAEGVRIQFVKDDRTVFTQDASHIYKNPNGEEIRLLVPSAALQKGDYQVSVRNPATDNPALKYGFSVN